MKTQEEKFRALVEDAPQPTRAPHNRWLIVALWISTLANAYFVGFLSQLCQEGKITWP
jgi:hypothetical protein